MEVKFTFFDRVFKKVEKFLSRSWTKRFCSTSLHIVQLFIVLVTKRDWKFFPVYDRELYSLRLETIFSRRFFSRRFFPRRFFSRRFLLNRFFSRRFLSTLSTVLAIDEYEFVQLRWIFTNYVGIYICPTTLEPFQLRWRKSYPKE